MLGNYKKNIDKRAIEDYKLYYPLSPNIAITINDNKNERIYELSEEEVESYNCAVINASQEFIIANNKNILEVIQKEMSDN